MKPEQEEELLDRHRRDELEEYLGGKIRRSNQLIRYGGIRERKESRKSYRFLAWIAV